MEHATHNEVRSEGPRRNKYGLTPTHIVWTKFELTSLISELCEHLSPQPSFPINDFFSFLH